MTDPRLSLRLLHPVTIKVGRGSNTYSVLELRRPTEMECNRVALRESVIDGAICCLALVCGVPESVIEQLSPRDLYAAIDFMKQF